MGRVGLDLRPSGHEPGARLAGVEGSPQGSPFERCRRAPESTQGHRNASKGAHRGTDWVQDTVTSIVTHRCNNRKPLIATTNLPDAEAGSRTFQKTAVGVDYLHTLREHVGDRARSRLFEMCKVIRINWSDDYRIRRGKRF